MRDSRVLAYAGLAASLLLVGCSGAARTSTDEASQETSPATTETQVATTAAQAETHEEWDAIIDDYADLQLALAKSNRAYEQALTSGGLDIASFREILASESEAIEAALGALPAEASDPGVQVSVTTVRTLLQDLATHAASIETLIDVDTVAAQQQLDDLLVDVSFDSAEEYEEYLAAQTYVEFFDETVSYWDLFGNLEGACFELQSTILTIGGGLVDCTRSDVDTDAIDEELSVDVDPRTQATGLVFAELPPGRHSFAIFEPGLTLDFEAPLKVRSSTDHLDLTSNDVDGLIVNVVRSDQGLVAGSENPDSSSQDFAAIPADLEEWVDALPVTVIATGDMQIGPDTSRYWDLEVDAERLENFPPTVLTLMIFAGEKTDAAFGALAVLNVAGASIRLIEWERSDYDDRLFVSWFNEGNLDIAAAEAFVEQVLSSAS